MHKIPKTMKAAVLYGEGDLRVVERPVPEPGWQEALVLMKPGSKWQLFVPPELAYDVNSPPAIPPGSLLQFEVELLSVNTPPPEAPQP